MSSYRSGLDDWAVAPVPSSTSHRRTWLWVLIGVVAVAIVVGVGFAIAGLLGAFSGGTSGFNDVGTLQSSVQRSYQANVDRVAPGAPRITSVKCTGTGTAHTYVCNLAIANGLVITHHITVSSNGSTWSADKVSGVTNPVPTP